MSTLENLIRPEVLGMRAYAVQDARGLIKLDAMENPYRLAPAAVSELLAAAASRVEINRYPDASCAALLDTVRREAGVPIGAAMLPGNGSDELIQIVIQALARPGAVVASPEPSFVMYRHLAHAFGLRHLPLPLRADFSADADGWLDAIHRERPAVVFIAYPNNPTGNLFERDLLEAVLAEAPGVVVIDEAYHPFAGESWLAETALRPRLLVMRTVSKLGLAGLRFGYLCGAPDWIAQFDKLRLPYNINSLTQAWAASLVGHPELARQAQAIIRDRSVLAEGLLALGVEVFPSAANFLLFRVQDAPAVFDGLRSNGVLIKRLHGAHPLLENCLRVTVGLPAENQAFLNALRTVLPAIH